MQLREKLRQGLVIPAHPLALNSARQLDERRQRTLTRYYLAAGDARGGGRRVRSRRRRDRGGAAADGAHAGLAGGLRARGSARPAGALGVVAGAALGTIVAPFSVSSSILTLTNWFGNSAESSFANAAFSLIVPVAVSI